MKLKRQVNVSGEKTINETKVNITFFYNIDGSTNVAPDSINFNYIAENVSVGGSCNIEKGITFYSVNGGIADDVLLTAIETECKLCLQNYDTI
ncbi:MAG: hypothetical protein RSE41_09060 [Clostridia bacterium]